MRLKRLRAPNFWKVVKKGTKWTVSPRPGPHKKFESIPLQIVVRDILDLTETGKEAKTIIRKGKVFVDGKPRKDHAFVVGLMDAVVIPDLKKFYRVLPTAKGLSLLEIPENESKLKLCRINDKKILAKGKTQLNLHDGKNILAQKDVYKTGDSILLQMPEQKIVEHVKLENGSLVLIFKGKNIGKVGEVKEIIETRTREPNKLICEIEGTKVETIKDYVFAVGKNKPIIAISE
jgi:small subunit ribosomal protein S4e